MSLGGVASPVTCGELPVHVCGDQPRSWVRRCAARLQTVLRFDRCGAQVINAVTQLLVSPGFLAGALLDGLTSRRLYVIRHFGCRAVM